MGDILSQSEIDDLLNALNTGELNVQDIEKNNKEKKIKSYDFTRPSKFSKEHLRTMEIIFENYSRTVSTYFTGYLRTVTRADLVSAEPVTYYEFSNSLTNPSILAIVDFLPLEGSIIIEVSPKIGYTIIDRILGGAGASSEKIRDFTEIEKNLIEKFINQFVAMLREPWETVQEIKPKLQKLETNPQFAQIVSPNEIIALITLNVNIGKVEGMMNICIPYLVVEPILDKLSTKYWFAGHEKRKEKVYTGTIEKQLQTAKIPIKAVLGKTNIPIKEVMNLQIGDVIPLDSYINLDLDILVGNLLKFKGKPGINNNKNSIQVTCVNTKEDQ